MVHLVCNEVTDQMNCKAECADVSSRAVSNLALQNVLMCLAEP